MKITTSDTLRVRQFVAKLRAFLDVPGISLAMSAGGGNVEACAGVGNLASKIPISPDSRFEAGCMTKLLTALTALQLVAEGRLDLDAPVSDYVTDLNGRNAGGISTRHLLSHTAGYQGDHSLDAHTISQYSWSEFCNAFTSGSMLFEPGTVFDYSHTASVIVGRVVERITGRASLVLADERIIQPLRKKMPASTDGSETVAGHVFSVSKQRYAPSPSTAWSAFWTDSLLAPAIKMRDLVSFGEALLGDGDLVDPIVSRLLMNPVINLPSLYGGKQVEDVAGAFGLGLAQYAPTIYGLSYTSATQTCALRIDLQNKIVIAVGINACQPYTRDFLINKLMGALVTEGSTARNLVGRKEIFSADQLIGHYEGRMKNSFELSAVGEELSIRLTDNSTMNQGSNRKPIVLLRNSDGYYVPRDDMRFLSMGFFRIPSSGIPCFMIGGNAYKRIGDAPGPRYMSINERTASG